MNTPSNNKSIYIVDDDESVCRALKTLLMTNGFEAKTFNSAKTFFDTVSNDDSSCLLLDIYMPVMDGWAVLKKDYRLWIETSGYFYFCREP
jgi:two-component system response regulator FixJ